MDRKMKKGRGKGLIWVRVMPRGEQGKGEDEDESDQNRPLAHWNGADEACRHAPLSQIQPRATPKVLPLLLILSGHSVGWTASKGSAGLCIPGRCGFSLHRTGTPPRESQGEPASFDVGPSRYRCDTSFRRYGSRRSRGR